MPANVYLHYVLDLWAERWRRREAKGDMVIVRYADDTIFGFESETDARRFLDAMRERLAAFVDAPSGQDPSDRVRPFAAANRERRGLSKPETFKFLGFIFICGKSRKGGFLLKRKSRGDRMRAKLKEIKEGLRKRMHEPPSRQGQWLGQVVQGWFNYHAVPTNIRVLSAFRFNVVDLWRCSLRRRSQKDVTTWKRIESLAREWLPPPKIHIRGRLTASASNTRGGGRMRESRPYGSQRGAFSNGRPHRDRTDGHRGRRKSPSYSSRQSMRTAPR